MELAALKGIRGCIELVSGNGIQRILLPVEDELCAVGGLCKYLPHRLLTGKVRRLHEYLRKITALKPGFRSGHQDFGIHLKFNDTAGSSSGDLKLLRLHHRPLQGRLKDRLFRLRLRYIHIDMIQVEIDKIRIRLHIVDRHRHLLRRRTLIG